VLLRLDLQFSPVSFGHLDVRFRVGIPRAKLIFKLGPESVNHICLHIEFRNRNRKQRPFADIVFLYSPEASVNTAVGDLVLDCTCSLFFQSVKLLNHREILFIYLS
jgi:hypothetical protein